LNLKHLRLELILGSVKRPDLLLNAHHLLHQQGQNNHFNLVALVDAKYEANYQH
jgi:hypothetical protein